MDTVRKSTLKQAEEHPLHRLMRCHANDKKIQRAIEIYDITDARTRLNIAPLVYSSQKCILCYSTRHSSITDSVTAAAILEPSARVRS